MKKLSLYFENCYGISKLETEFDFTDKQTCAIYAPNGVMKTSFAKTFKDLCNGVNTIDVIFPERITLRKIMDENKTDINSTEVFVIEPYNEQFNSDKLSTLLVTKELKQEYDEIYRDLEVEKGNFIRKLKATSQSTDCESELTSTFSYKYTNIFELLSEIFKRLDGKQARYDFRYNDIFDKKGKVKDFLAKHQDSLDRYISSYQKLISNSKLFKKNKNSFGTYQAGAVLKSVSNDSFFEAGHCIQLADATQIHCAKEFEQLLQAEIDRIVEDKELKKIFEKVDKAIGSNEELRAFKSVIETNNLLLVELKNYEFFKKKVWLGYLDQLKVEVEQLIKFYEERKSRLEDIIERAKSEETEWDKSVKEFNSRFKGLPFLLAIRNKTDVMLNTDTPSVAFIFKDRGDQKEVERDQLLTVLSQGERRALYLLNIIFEIRARKKLKQNTVFIIDDIADSFDYKNKYAIIEYLNDISKISGFHQLILTHNFDFFRTLESRGIVGYSNCYFTYKSAVKVILEKASGGIKNPFINDWKSHLSQNNKLVASIPFARNLIEYTKGEQDLDFKKLTSLLHWKNDTETILISDLKLIFENTFSDITFPTTNLTTPVIDLIFQEAEQCLQTNEGMNFESKIVLSIAIRLKAEKYMIDKIDDSDFVDSISRNQTIRLINKYISMFQSEHANIELLEQVNLITPENIHLNSFMYEPIIDLGMDSLADLYCRLKAIT